MYGVCHLTGGFGSATMRRTMHKCPLVTVSFALNTFGNLHKQHTIEDNNNMIILIVAYSELLHHRTRLQSHKVFNRDGI